MFIARSAAWSKITLQIISAIKCGNKISLSISSLAPLCQNDKSKIINFRNFITDPVDETINDHPADEWSNFDDRNFWSQKSVKIDSFSCGPTMNPILDMNLVRNLGFGPASPVMSAQSHCSKATLIRQVTLQRRLPHLDS